jgi:peroxiredoxin
LRSFERQSEEFLKRNTKVVAISVDSLEESRRLAQTQGYTFPILSDPDTKTIRAYGVLHERGGEDGRDIARPAEFLVDAAGTIRWVNLSESVVARLEPETVLQAIDAMAVPR